MTFALYRADARALPLPDASVDLIVTSPPYFALRSYQDDGEHYEGQIGSEGTPAEFLTALWAVLDECWRVLKPSGSCFVNLGDKFSGSGGHNNAGLAPPRTGEFATRKHSGSIEATRRNAPDTYNKATDVRPKSRMLLPHRFALGAIDPDYRTHVEVPGNYPQWVCRMDIVWAKPNGLPESVTDRVRASHEYWFHLTRSEGYFAAVDEVREEYSERVQERQTYAGRDIEPAKDYANRGDGNPARGILGFAHNGANPLGKLPGSVWTIASEPLRVPDDLPQHFAAFPSEWPKRLIAGWSPTGICTRCGEGRRPVVEKERVPHYAGGSKGVRNGHPREDDTEPRWNSEATITGYACACPQPDAPTRPAVVLDPFCGTGTTVAVAHHLGRHGIGIDLSADYLRLAHWRCTQDWALREKITGSRPVTTDPNQLELFA